MAKEKAGLHKDIASIFGDISVPGRPRTQQEKPAAPQVKKTGRLPKPKPRTEEPSLLVKAEPKEPLAPQKSPHPQKPGDEKPTSTPQSKLKKSVQELWQQIQNKLFQPKPGVDATRQKVMAMLVPVLFIVFIFVFVRLSGPAGSRRTIPQEPQPSAAISGSKEINWRFPEPYPATLRDPMKFSVVKKATSKLSGEHEQITVNGIVWSEQNPLAIIGKQIVGEGESIGTARVIKITKDAVVFEANGIKWTQKVR